MRDKDDGGIVSGKIASQQSLAGGIGGKDGSSGR